MKKSKIANLASAKAPPLDLDSGVRQDIMEVIHEYEIGNVHYGDLASAITRKLKMPTYSRKISIDNAPIVGRPEVVAFANAMEKKLAQNDGKGGWADMMPHQIFVRIVDELVEAFACFRGASEEDRCDARAFDSHLRAAKDALIGVKLRLRKDGSELTGDTLEEEAADVANFLMMLVDNVAIRKAKPARRRAGAKPKKASHTK